jgi:hypothetical protein
MELHPGLQDREDPKSNHLKERSAGEKAGQSRGRGARRWRGGQAAGRRACALATRPGVGVGWGAVAGSLRDARSPAGPMGREEHGGARWGRRGADGAPHGRLGAGHARLRLGPGLPPLRLGAAPASRAARVDSRRSGRAQRPQPPAALPGCRPRRRRALGRRPRAA